MGTQPCGSYPGPQTKAGLTICFQRHKLPDFSAPVELLLAFQGGLDVSVDESIVDDRSYSAAHGRYFSRDLQKYLKIILQEVEGLLSPSYGKNQGNLSWGCSCYLCSWVNPEKTWITILILSWPGLIPMCRFRERNTLAKVHNQFIDGVSQWGRKEPCFIKTTYHHPHGLHRL